jgi:N-acetylmuramoyl-L-alanine amidase
MGNDPLGKPEAITLHWTAGSYQQTFDHYHICITGDGRGIMTLPLSKKGSHVWGRNSGNIGIALCAMSNARTMPTAKQIEEAAAIVADLCKQFDIDLHADRACQRHKVIGQTRVPIQDTMQVPYVADHAAYARCDGYYPDRWDCGRYTDEILKKAAWYRDQIADGKRKARTWK